MKSKLVLLLKKSYIKVQFIYFYNFFDIHYNIFKKNLPIYVINPFIYRKNEVHTNYLPKQFCCI